MFTGLMFKVQDSCFIIWSFLLQDSGFLFTAKDLGFRVEYYNSEFRA